MNMLHCTVYIHQAVQRIACPWQTVAVFSPQVCCCRCEMKLRCHSPHLYNHDAKKRNHHKKLANKSILFRKKRRASASAFVTCWNYNFINVNRCLDKWHATLINLSGHLPEASWLSSLAYGCTGAVLLAAEAGIRLGRMSAILSSDSVNTRHFRMRHVP